MKSVGGTVWSIFPQSAKKHGGTTFQRSLSNPHLLVSLAIRSTSTAKGAINPDLLENLFFSHFFLVFPLAISQNDIRFNCPSILRFSQVFYQFLWIFYLYFTDQDQHSFILPPVHSLSTFFYFCLLKDFPRLRVPTCLLGVSFLLFLINLLCFMNHYSSYTSPDAASPLHNM